MRSQRTGPPGLMDAGWMRRALKLAETARGRTSPNPLVGAVLVDREGRLAGEGFHRRAGEPHAEVEALRAAGERARGGTLYVTLEPCNHHGRTPPCTDAILAAGVSRVVVAWPDPNPHVRGGGIERLRAAGLSVEVGVLEAEAARQNAAFARLVTTGRPLVTLKLAASLDGRIATATGESRWITGEAARRLVHEMRDAADAVAVGVATVLADDPLLTVRLPPRGRRAARLAIPKRPLWRVVVDPALRLPHEARVLAPTPSARTLVACGPEAPRDRRAKLEAAGAAVVSLPLLPEPTAVPPTLLPEHPAEAAQSLFPGHLSGSRSAAPSGPETPACEGPALPGPQGAPAEPQTLRGGKAGTLRATPGGKPAGGLGIGTGTCGPGAHGPRSEQTDQGPRGACGSPEWSGPPRMRSGHPGYLAPPHGQLDLRALLDELGRLEVADLLVEGGAELAGALLDQRLVDRIAFFYAPILIGGRAARGMIGGVGTPSLATALRVTRLRRRRIGEDLLVEGDVVPPGAEPGADGRLPGGE